jgi:polyhydroxyalkanoate synthase
MNPRLNVCYYENIDFEKAMSAYLSLSGAIPLPPQAVDESPFVMAQTIARSEGYVIHEDEYLQLIYFPVPSKKKHQNPIFIVPSWINKYYIFDLSEHNSFVAWLVSQDIPVYCISWVNPDRSYFEQTLSDYIQKGIHHAVSVALKHSGGQQINMIGYCIGGVALMLYAGFLAQQKVNWIASLTFLATPFDFEKLDNLNLFMDESHFDHLRTLMNDEGVFKGDRMMQSFSLLRYNDALIQNIIDQIYLEKKPKPMDFLFWNADVTHIPANVHLNYLRDIFMANGFMKKPTVVSNIAVDFDLIDCPVFVFGAERDYIVPWESTFASKQIFKKLTFCLGGSGHVVGVINPPNQQKYGYQTGAVGKKTASSWLQTAKHNDGSWWTYWLNWLQPSLGKIKRSNSLLSPEIIIEPAPGRYVLQKAPAI